MAVSAADDSRVSNSTASCGNCIEAKGRGRPPRGREEEEGLLMVGRMKALAVLAAVAAKAKDKVVKVFIFFCFWMRCVCVYIWVCMCHFHAYAAYVTTMRECWID